VGVAGLASGGRAPRQAGVGEKTRSAGRGPAQPDGYDDDEETDATMELTYTGRGLSVTDEIRETAQRKLAPLERLEPRTTRIDLEFISEHHPKPDGMKRVEAALSIPRKTFRARAEAGDVPSALDDVVDKLERQLRDHHGKRRGRFHRGLESAHPSAEAADTSEG